MATLYAILFFLCSLFKVAFVVAQTAPPAKAQLNTFNSTVIITPSQIQAASLDRKTSLAAQVALRFEQSNWAGQSVSQSFYNVPESSAALPFGTLIKKEDFTNTTLYTLPPHIALSRFLYQSETLNGTAVPASAYVLWPYSARHFPNVKGVPIVAWAHGNSGWKAECAPSHMRDLWYQYHAPFELALAGYAVVAPDLAGLGVETNGRGQKITHQWLSNPSFANDIVHAVRAAQQGFPVLSSEFVVFGHSQGGGAAWATAIRQAKKPVAGYLGAIAASPGTNIADEIANSPIEATFLAPGLAYMMKTVFPSFKKSDFLTPLGIRRLKLVDELQGCNAVANQLITADTAKPDFTDSWYLKAFDNIMSVGGKDIAGPLLVLQGTADPAINATITRKVVNTTCSAHRSRTLQYVEFVGASHVPTLYASRRVWMDWIADRFNSVALPAGCTRETVNPLRDVSAYQKEIGFYLEYSLFPYENF